MLYPLILHSNLLTYYYIIWETGLKYIQNYTNIYINCRNSPKKFSNRYDINLTSLTYQKNFSSKRHEFTYSFGRISMAVNLKLLESDRLDQKKYRKLFLEKDTRDQNRHKHGDNLGSKETNHKMTKFPERSEVCLFSLQEALCFYFNIIGSFIKSLTSFVLNKHVHWFVFFISIRFK